MKIYRTPIKNPAYANDPDWGYDIPNKDSDTILDWVSCSDLTLVHDQKQRGTFRSARWECYFSPDLCWVSSSAGRSLPAGCQDFPHSHHPPSLVYVGLTSSHMQHGQ